MIESGLTWHKRRAQLLYIVLRGHRSNDIERWQSSWNVVDSIECGVMQFEILIILMYEGIPNIEGWVFILYYSIFLTIMEAFPRIMGYN